MNDFNKFLYHYFSGKNPKKWHPFLAVYYLTYGCNFRCPYCSDGSGKPYHQLPNKIVPSVDVLQILKNIRKNCNTLVISGGEPLNYPEFSEVISNLKPIKFKEVLLTTNGFRINEFLDVFPNNITSLSVSLDTMNPEKADKYYGNGEGTFRKIMNNIELMHNHSSRNYNINISSVVTPDNISDLMDVYEFSQQRGYMFAAAPHLQGVVANEGLIHNTDYYNFYDFLRKEKLKGRRIFGSPLYLEYMRDLKKFTCKPFTMLVVSPIGEIFYPCLEIGHNAGNILQNHNLNQVKELAEKKYGLPPQCNNQCHSACALGFGAFLQFPIKTIFEEFKCKI